MEPAQPEHETTFEDGNISFVVRVGGTVRRKPGFWTPAVHALLRHLEVAGFEHSPRVLGIDSRGREILTYVEGETGPSTLEGIRSDKLLVAVAQLVRRYHDAVSSFQPPADAAWQITVGAPTSGDIICHNDLAPWNTIFREGQPVAFIDWDFAAPGTREWDLAYALWRYVPLYPDEEEFGSPRERGRRMTLFCRAYGYDNPMGLVSTIEQRQQVLYDTLETWGKAGVPGFAEMWRDGHGNGILRDIEYLRRHREMLGTSLTAG